jgi:hypothetical protein
MDALGQTPLAGRVGVVGMQMGLHDGIVLQSGRKWGTVPAS